MKTLSTTLFSGLTAAQLNTLTSVVSETLATGTDKPKSKTFTAAELWNIQRQKKAISSRRYSF